jgi:O-methyltransferase/methyltransferase family protein
MSTTAGAQELPAGARMMQMIAGKWVSRAISAAAELGIADLLAEGERGTAELADACGAHEPSLYRLLRALASLEIFAETAPRRFVLTPLADCLRTDSPDSLRAMARFISTPLAWNSWGHLTDAVRSGESCVQKMGIGNPFEYLKAHPDEAGVFHEAMTNLSRQSAPTIAEAYDFGRYRKLVDVAGGHGLLLTTVLARYPSLEGVVFDLPGVVSGASDAIRAAGLEGRCQAVGGDFFEAVPEGADCYMMKHIIHDWDDEPSAAILRNCRRAVAEGGRVLVLEMILAPGNEADFSKLLDLEMLAIPGGRERTETEYRELFTAAGLELTAVIPTRSPISVMEGRPI